MNIDQTGIVLVFGAVDATDEKKWAKQVFIPGKNEKHALTSMLSRS